MGVVLLPRLFLQLTSSCNMVKVEECDPDKWGDAKRYADERNSAEQQVCTCRGGGGSREAQRPPGLYGLLLLAALSLF